MTTTENSNRITIACEQAENIAYLERIQRPLKNEVFYDAESGFGDALENEASYDSKSDFEYFEDVLKIKNNIDRENKIKQLIKDDVNINATKDGKTILDIAIEKRCSPEIVKSLVSNGGKINTIDADGRTVLHRSVKNKNRKVVEVLLEAKKRSALASISRTLFSIYAMSSNRSQR
ncbi:MAG: ankyrin repeat domain-containing protein [Wolbachia endosymbiont of Armadillidium vulgare]|uniref:ankyrin repeat domain-containing protein n=1 Tax=Wolbachia endosymbiont of Armadillidium vulgare TaxID=77039 RepID=UPI0009181BBD|nr:ankyrin repeat domain-containing protein [Wolbachia endosymbiont of Armadillidium vulgare]OJH31248.1 Ankyrin repeats (3 copies) [Wolbachia endosymbiont of Armadillidium vulgare]OJH32442.1 Ankyrin repeats (3 copies) [Wolbachia endosymbiont of Armadillidium vulgare]